jgi:hypothetical protein
MSIEKDVLIGVVHEFLRAENEVDRQSWLNLFAEDAVHEQGPRRLVGLDQIAENWDARISKAGVHLWCEDPVFLKDNEAMAIIRCRIASRTDEFRVINHYLFDEDGKIKQLRNFIS